MKPKNASPSAILSVTAINTLVKLRIVPPTLLMHVTGVVSSSGWTGIVLTPRVYVTPPDDGILEFDLVGTPPSGIALQMVIPVSAEISMPLDLWVEGVRVIASNNVIEATFAATQQPLFDTQAFVPAGFIPEDQAFDPLLLAEVEESAAISARDGETCADFVLASSNIPEFKTEFEVKCVVPKPFSSGCLVQTKVPVLYRRTSKQQLVARVCYPNGQSIEQHLKDCVTEAVIAGVAVGVLTSGNLPAAGAALQGQLILCLKRKLGTSVSISVGLKREKVAGNWHRV